MTRSLLGAIYPDTPSNLVSAAITNNLANDDSTLVKAEQIGASGVEITSLNNEILSLSLILYGYLSGDVSDLPIDPIQAAKSKQALNDLSNNDLSDTEFLLVFQEAVKIWPAILKADHSLTVVEVNNYAGSDGEIKTSRLKDHIITTLDATTLIETIRHYVSRVYQKTKEFGGS